MNNPSPPMAPPSPDLDLVPGDDWPLREFPIDDGRRRDSVRVVIRQSVLNDIHRHGLGNTHVEVCGVLVGNVYRDQRGPFVYVEANIRGRHSDSQTAQVTFTAETWNHIHGEMDRHHPDQRILGWYHTHPGFGIFLSGMDLFIHENFFNGHEQMALVFDPISGDEGLFLWRGGKAVRDGFLIERDAAEDPPRESTVPASDPPLTAGAGMGSTGMGSTGMGSTGMGSTERGGEELSARLARIERRQMLGTLALLFALTLAVVVPLATWFVWPGPFVLHPPGRRANPPAPGPIEQSLDLDRSQRHDDALPREAPLVEAPAASHLDESSETETKLPASQGRSESPSEPAGEHAPPDESASEPNSTHDD